MFLRQNQIWRGSTEFDANFVTIWTISNLYFVHKIKVLQLDTIFLAKMYCIHTVENYRTRFLVWQIPYDRICQTKNRIVEYFKVRICTHFCVIIMTSSYDDRKKAEIRIEWNLLYEISYERIYQTKKCITVCNSFLLCNVQYSDKDGFAQHRNYAIGHGSDLKIVFVCSVLKKCSIMYSLFGISCSDNFKKK